MHHNPSNSGPSNRTIRVSAVVLTNDHGQIALVRKHHTQFFIFPGGKPEIGETGEDAAVREVGEELGVELADHDLQHLGDYTTAAANEAETELVSQVYAATLPAGVPVTAQAEIADLIWMDLRNIQLPEGTQLAPLTALMLESAACTDRMGRSWT